MGTFIDVHHRERAFDARSKRCEIVFFDSHEDAMRNSKLPETQEFAKRLRNAIDGEPTYYDLDVVEEQTL